MRIVAVLLCLLAVTARPRAETPPPPRKVFGVYQQTVWRDTDGLPHNSVYAISQTPEGYLWLGTAEGLVRFDGVRFTVFDRTNTLELKDAQILTLLNDREGNLWIGTGRGVVRYGNGRFTRFDTRDGLTNDYVTALVQDKAGALWIGTDGGGISMWNGERFRTYGTAEGLPDLHVWTLALTADGNVCAGTNAGLAELHEGRFFTRTTQDGLPADQVHALYLDRAGSLWIGTEEGLCVLRGARIETVLPHTRVRTLMEDAEDNLWVGTLGGGIVRRNAGTLSVYRAQEGLTSDVIEVLHEDRTGGIWIGTNGGGLCRLKHPRIETVTTADGLTSNGARSILQDTHGDMWIGTEEGLNRFNDGRLVPLADEALTKGKTRSITEDREGNVWITTDSTHGAIWNLYRATETGFAPQTLGGSAGDHLIWCTLGAREGGLWVGTRSGGLNLFRDGRWTTYRESDGLAEDFVGALYQDRAGTLWVGTLNGGVSRFKDGKFTNWNTNDGLGSNIVLCFAEDSTGSLWIGTHGGGLSRLKDGKIATITSRDGLYDNLAFSIIEDEDANLWMSCNKGIYHASVRELNDFADRRLSRVASYSYGVADGMLSRECNGGYPAGARAADGKLWFPTIAGIAIVDPKRSNKSPPQVVIERLLIDRAPNLPNESLRMQPGQEELQIEYTALSWERPQQIRFEYQLDGLDREWIDAGTRRTAYYSHLPPGNYTFRLRADNGEGVWATQPATVTITVLPPFWRTWWFLSLGALAVLAAIVSGFRWRGAQLQRRVAAQEEFSRRLMDAHESERRRIAAELHDGLGQRLAMIKNRAVANQDPQIAEQSASAIAEMREIAHNLRPYLLDRLGLTRALRSMFDKVDETSAFHLQAEVEDIDGRFAPQDEISLYRVIQENLNNILKHSEASEVNISVRAKPDVVHITIADNGRGFDPQKASLGNTGTGGFGLVGIAERVRLLGGAIEFASASGQGTKITMFLPSPSSVRA